MYAAKYVYNFWRPLAAIRNADLDGHPDTVADPAWTSVLTASNHPEYPSAHSYQAGAAAEVLASTFGDDVAFSIGSVTLPNVVRSFEGFSQAAAEVGESRIYGGIHFRGSSVTGAHANASTSCRAWFDKDEPMRGDLQHWFACEPGCTTFCENIRPSIPPTTKK